MKNPCELRSKMMAAKPIPANVFGYLCICLGIRQRAMALQQQAQPVHSRLPFASPITQRYSHEGAIKTHWSYLRY